MAKPRNNEKLRFVLVGAINTLIDFGLLFILRELNILIIIANIISTTTAFGFSFIANKNFTFKGGGDNVRRELVLFIIVTLFGLWVLQSIVIWVTSPTLFYLTHDAALTVFLAKLLATAVTLVWNYMLYSRIVFKKTPRP